MAWGIKGSSSFSNSSTTSNTTGRERSSTQTKRLTDAQYMELSRTMRELQGDVESEDIAYSKDQAVKDSKGLVDNIFAEYRDQDLPQILEKQGATGAYSSTGTQLLANDAYARTTAKASSAVLGAIASYADIQNQKRATSTNALSSVLSGLLASREDTTTQSVFSTSSKSKSKGQTHKISGSYSSMQ